MSWLLQTASQWTLECVHLFGSCFSWIYAQGGIAGSCGGSIFTFKRKLHTILHSGYSVQWLSRVRLFATPWTVACQDPLSTGFSRQEYWSGLPFPSPGDLLDPGIEPMSPAYSTFADTFMFWATRENAVSWCREVAQSCLTLLLPSGL